MAVSDKNIDLVIVTKVSHQESSPYNLENQRQVFEDFYKKLEARGHKMPINNLKKNSKKPKDEVNALQLCIKHRLIWPDGYSYTSDAGDPNMKQLKSRGNPSG